MFSGKNYVQNFDTRFKHKFYVPLSRMCLNSNTPEAISPKMFNEVPEYTKASATEAIFKKTLRFYLFSMSVYSMNNFIINYIHLLQYFFLTFSFNKYTCIHFIYVLYVS